MKRIFFILLIIPFISSYGQTVQYFSVVFDSGSTTGTTITLPKTMFLSGAVVVDSLSDSTYYQTYDTGVWTNITNEAGAVVYYKASTTEDRAYAVDPKYFYPWKIIRMRTTDKPVKSRTVKIIGKQY
jgi:hypothetical protein